MREGPMNARSAALHLMIVFVIASVLPPIALAESEETPREQFHDLTFRYSQIKNDLWEREREGSLSGADADLAAELRWACRLIDQRILLTEFLMAEFEPGEGPDNWGVTLFAAANSHKYEQQICDEVMSQCESPELRAAAESIRELVMRMSRVYAELSVLIQRRED